MVPRSRHCEKGQKKNNNRAKQQIYRHSKQHLTSKITQGIIVFFFRKSYNKTFCINFIKTTFVHMAIFMLAYQTHFHLNAFNRPRVELETIKNSEVTGTFGRRGERRKKKVSVIFKKYLPYALSLLSKICYWHDVIFWCTVTKKYDKDMTRAQERLLYEKEGSAPRKFLNCISHLRSPNSTTTISTFVIH